MTSSTFRASDGALRAPWRLAAFGVAVIAASFVAAVVLLPLAVATPLANWARDARVPLDQVATALSLIVATWLTGRIAPPTAQSIWKYAGLGRTAWAWRATVPALVAGALVIVVPTFVVAMTGGAHFEASPATDSGGIVAWAAFALMVPAAISEEMIFRGYAFSACVDGMGARGAVIATSVAFALAHLFNPDPTVASITAVACAGAFLAIVRLTTGSLVAACAAHFAINYAQSVALHAPVSGIALQTPGYRLVATGPDWLTGGSWGPEAGAGVIVVVAVASFVYLKRFRRQTAQ